MAIEPNGKAWELVGAAVAPISREAVKDSIVIDVPTVANTVRSLLKEAGIRASGGVCAIAGSQVIVRQVQFPRMSESVLRKSIKYEAAKFIAASVEDSIVEFEIMGNALEDGQMNVMLAAAPRELVDSHVRVLEAAGLEPVAVDVEAFALMRSLVDFNASDEYYHGTVALLDMGASHTDVNIISKGEFALTRNIPIGGDGISNAIKSFTGCSFEDAEQMKVAMTGDVALDALANDGANQVWRAVQPLLEELIREIRRSIHFYQSQFPNGGSDTMVSKIMLTGGSARMSGIDAYMSSRLNIPAEKADVFKQSVISPGRSLQPFVNEHGAILAVSAGLALKELTSESRLKVAA
jgi:type IV pilus assembly protein PilM